MFRLLHVGQHRYEVWNRYPLHPGPNVVLPGFPAFRVPPSAYRAKNNLILDVTPFSDNTFGHPAPGSSQRRPADNVSGSYALYQNGNKIASGKALQSLNGNDLLVQAALAATPAQIKFAMTAIPEGRG